ncbi:MAG: type II toxin-antitoxin system VapC family toxin [Proteobacteria bacterium]|nr:type II toxin-antitoxin system VapC family toxin [Pseudomonadota bacterium]
MKDVLLDTHVWIWITIEDNKQISKKAKNQLQSARQKWISAISCWELAKLAEKKRISFSIPVITWIRRSLSEYRINVAELSPEVAVESTILKGFHHDPADQIIVATSRILGIPLVTSDRKILDFVDVESVW